MAGAIHYSLGLNAGPLVKGFSIASGAVSGFMGIAGKIARLGSMLGGALGLGGGLMAFKQAIEGAADMESTEVAFETLIGSATRAQKALGDLKAFAAETPFEFPEITDAAKKLLAFGSASETITQELRMLGDISSGVAAPLGEIAELYGKARVQGRLMAEDVNQLTGRGIPVIQEFAKQFGVATSEVRGLVETGSVGFEQLRTALQSLTGEGGRFFDMTKRQSQTALGLWSTLKDNIGEVLREFGKPVLVELKVALQQAIGLAGSLVATAQEWGRKVADAMAIMRQLFSQGNLWETLKSGLVAAFGGGINFLVKALAGVATAFGGALEGAIRGAFEGDSAGKAVTGMLQGFTKGFAAMPDLVNTAKSKNAWSKNISDALGAVKFERDFQAWQDEIFAKPDAPAGDMGEVGSGVGPGRKERFVGGGATPVDSLAKMGLFIGRGGPSGEKHWRETARATAASEKHLAKIAENTKPAARPAIL